MVTFPYFTYYQCLLLDALMGDGLLTVPFTPQNYLLTRSCQQLSSQGPERMAKEPNLKH